MKNKVYVQKWYLGCPLDLMVGTEECPFMEVGSLMSYKKDSLKIKLLECDEPWHKWQTYKHIEYLCRKTTSIFLAEFPVFTLNFLCVNEKRIIFYETNKLIKFMKNDDGIATITF